MKYWQTHMNLNISAWAWFSTVTPFMDHTCNRFSLRYLSNLNFLVFGDVYWQTSAKRAITRAKKTILYFADQVIFRWQPRNNGSQRSVAISITWRYSRHCCWHIFATRDHINKSYFLVASVSNKMHKIFSRPTQNSFATQIWVATHRLGSTNILVIIEL